MDDEDKKGPRLVVAGDGPGVGDLYALDDVDKKLLQFTAKYPDATDAELMRLTGLSRHILQKRMARPAYRVMLKRMHETTEDIIIRGQRTAAQRLVELCRSSNEKLALEAARILLNPMLNKHTTETKFSKELIFRSQIGKEGQMMQEVVQIEDETGKKARRLPPSPTGALPAYDTEGNGPPDMDDEGLGDLDD